MNKEVSRSPDGRTVQFYIITDICPDVLRWNWRTGEYDREESTTSQRYFAENLQGLTEDQTVELYINSMGGSVKEALGIVNVLKRCPAKVVAYIDGFAASAASVITQGADEVWMPRNTCMMLHNARWVVEGNPKELRKSADDLEVINQSIINSYAARAGAKLPANVLQQILDAETWLTAEDCVRYGLADGLTDYEADLDAAAQQLTESGQLDEEPEPEKLPENLVARLKVLPSPAPQNRKPQARKAPEIKKSTGERIADAIKKLEVI